MEKQVQRVLLQLIMKTQNGALRSQRVFKMVNTVTWFMKFKRRVLVREHRKCFRDHVSTFQKQYIVANGLKSLGTPCHLVHSALQSL
jgi:hypothetical protein